MGSLVAAVAAPKCAAHPTVCPRFKKLVLSGVKIIVQQPKPAAAQVVVFQHARFDFDNFSS